MSDEKPVPAAEGAPAATDDPTTAIPSALPKPEKQDAKPDPAEDDDDLGPGEDDDGEDEGTDDLTAEGEPKKKLSRSQRASREKQRLHAENQDLKRRLAAVGPSSDATIADELGAKPKPEDFANDPDPFAYERAMQAYAVDERAVKREKARRQKERTELEAREAASNQRMFNERCREVKTQIPDFDTVMRTGGATVEVSNLVQKLILESEKGPLIAYDLAKHPEKSEKLNNASPLEAAKMIGRMEARLSLPNQRKATNAPAPNAPLKGGASLPFDPAKADMVAYAAHYQERLKKRA